MRAPENGAHSNGTPSVLLCDHAKVVLDASGRPKSYIQRAIAADFGDEGVVSLGSEVVDMGCLGEKDLRTISRLAGAAAEDDVSLAVRLGATWMYAVRHAESRSAPGDWAHVQTSGVTRAAATRTSGSRRRRSTSVPHFWCKVSHTVSFMCTGL